MKQPKPRHKDRLTVKRHILKKLKPGKYTDGGGLALLVSDIGSKSWSFRFERNGCDRAMVLGSLRDLTLDEARAEAAQLRAQLKLGNDPIDLKRFAARAVAQAAIDEAAEAARSKTFEQAASEYFDSYNSEWKSKDYRAKFLSTLRQYAFPKIGHRPVSAIDTAAVLSVIEPIWKLKANTADRVRNRIENILDWAKARGYRTGDNPASWDQIKFAKLPAKPKTKRHTALPYLKVPAFVAELANSEGISRRALEFLILCASRSAEVRGAKWNEFELGTVPVMVLDEEGQQWLVNPPFWTIPAERMKEGKLHRVPLVDRAVEILKKLPHQGEFVFARNNKPLGKNTFFDLLGAMQLDVTTHGFRSSFRTWAGNETDFPADVCEVAIAHAVGEKIQAVYQRGDLLERRRVLMKAWAQYCLTPKGDGDTTVIPINRKVG